MIRVFLFGLYLINTVSHFCKNSWPGCSKVRVKLFILDKIKVFRTTFLPFGDSFLEIQDNSFFLDEVRPRNVARLSESVQWYYSLS